MCERVSCVRIIVCSAMGSVYKCMELFLSYEMHAWLCIYAINSFWNIADTSQILSLEVV